jgi:hypothetical protein
LRSTLDVAGNGDALQDLAGLLQQLPKLRHSVKQTSAGMRTHTQAIVGFSLLVLLWLAWLLCAQ